MSCETFIGKVTNELSTLYKQYQTVSKNTVGVGELGKATVNSLVGPFFTTISGCKADVEQAESKNEGLFVKTNDQGKKLGELLNKQQTLQQQISEFEKSSKPKLEKAEIDLFLKLDGKIDDSAKSVHALIESIRKLHTRVENNKGALVMINQAIKPLAAKEPTWSIVGQVVVKIASTAGFLIAGGVDAPEVMKSLELTKEIAENSDRVLSALETAGEAAEHLNQLIKKRSK
jgi:hypothetical protein